VLERAARPQRRGLLIFRHRDPLALRSAGVSMPRRAAPACRVEETVGGEDRQPDEAVVAMASAIISEDIDISLMSKSAN